MEMSLHEINNNKLQQYPFLKEMYNDSYFPDFLVDKGQAILIELCLDIQNKQPRDLKELYALTHSATDQFNRLADEFEQNDSEIETAAREAIALDFAIITDAYGFDAELEELIAPRHW